MLHKLLPYVFLTFILLFVVVLIFKLFSFHRENKVLTESVRQYQKLIEQKEQEISALQSQIEALQKEQVLREKRIVVLKKQRAEIKAPATETELIKKFKELGYEASIR